MKMISQNEHYRRIYERIQMLIEGGVDDPDYQVPLSKEALTAKLAALVFAANEMSFTVGMALSDLGISQENNPRVIDNFHWAMDDLHIPKI